MARHILTIVTMTAFLGIAAFGVFAMGHASEHVMGCLAAATQQAPCPVSDPLASASFHVGVFKSFSKAIVDIAPFVAALIVLAALISTANLIAQRVRETSIAGDSPAGWLTLRSAAPFPLILALIAWHSLHEHSPALA